jgi:alpha-ketoglutarate-dependent taurine dioxygenase
MQASDITARFGALTDDQVEALLTASAILDIRYADTVESFDSALAVAAKVATGDETLSDIGAAWAAARTAEREAMVRLTGAIALSSVSTAETHMASIAGTDRMTIRKALNKR